MRLKKGEDATVTVDVEPEHEFGLAAANLIRSKDWNADYLQQVGIVVFNRLA